jgi:hypothetical protein
MFQATYQDPTRPYVVSVEILVAADGVPVVYRLGFFARRLSADGDETGRLVSLDALTSADWSVIPGDDLRVPLASIVHTALDLVIANGEVAAPGTPSRPSQPFRDANVRFVDGDVLRPATARVERPARRRPTVLTPSHLAEVARVCADARERGESTRRAVADAFDISENTARNWIQKGQQQGVIPRSK